MRIRTFRKGGIHPKSEKLTAGFPIQNIPVPGEIAVPLRQSIGAPPKCIVKPGDHLEAGQMIAEADAFVCAPVHTPAAGTVKRIDNVRDPQGLWQQAVIIAVDPAAADATEPENGRHQDVRSQREVSDLSRKEIIDIVSQSGIVGLGGATFPTRVKFSIPENKSVDIVVLNGAECEPYLTCDDELMRTSAAEILKGCRLIMKAVDAKRAVIGIEVNKPEAIAAMSKEIGTARDIKVIPLKKKYPQGSEKHLIAACTGREVAPGWLPVDVGVVVDNVGTAYSIYDAVYNRRPLTSRVVTVTGPSLASPGNFRVSIGTPISALIEKAGGLPDDTGKVIAGGPMMGRAMSCLDAPVTKGLSGVLVLPRSMSERRPAQACIRCARCVDACPMGLSPYLIMNFSQAKDWDGAAAANSTACIECGSCSFVCPSARPILDYIRLAKSEYRKISSRKK